MKEVHLSDRRILLELDDNCRSSLNQIGKRVRLSKEVVNYRIKRLEDLGIIQGYRAVIDFSKLGIQSYRMYLKFQNTSQTKEQEIIDFLKNNKRVWWLGRATGWIDLDFGIWVTSDPEFYLFLKEFLSRYRPFIQKEYLSKIIEYIHNLRVYLTDKKGNESKPLVIGSGILIETDLTDRKILSLLAHQGRISLVEIASKVKLTPEAVKYRIKRLEREKVILGYKALINTSKLGMQYFKVDMFLEDFSKLKMLEAYCHYHSNIVYIDRTIGGSDLEFDLEVKDVSQMLSILSEMKEKFSNTIRNFEYFSVVEIYKTIYFPE